jgi:hypothetical protein
MVYSFLYLFFSDILIFFLTDKNTNYFIGQHFSQSVSKRIYLIHIQIRIIELYNNTILNNIKRTGMSVNDVNEHKLLCLETSKWYFELFSLSKSAGIKDFVVEEEEYIFEDEEVKETTRVTENRFHNLRKIIKAPTRLLSPIPTENININVIKNIVKKSNASILT